MFALISFLPLRFLFRLFTLHSEAGGYLVCTKFGILREWIVYFHHVAKSFHASAAVSIKPSSTE